MPYNFETPYDRIANELAAKTIARTRITKHSGAIMYVNQLIIDLKLQQAGHAPGEPITPERLNEWAEYRRDLENCSFDGCMR